MTWRQALLFVLGWLLAAIGVLGLAATGLCAGAGAFFSHPEMGTIVLPFAIGFLCLWLLGLYLIR